MFDFLLWWRHYLLGNRGCRAPRSPRWRLGLGLGTDHVRGGFWLEIPPLARSTFPFLHSDAISNSTLNSPPFWREVGCEDKPIRGQCNAHAAFYVTLQKTRRCFGQRGSRARNKWAVSTRQSFGVSSGSRSRAVCYINHWALCLLAWLAFVWAVRLKTLALTFRSR